MTLLISSCTEEAPGLQQKLVEMEARLAGKQAEISELQAKLKELRGNGGGPNAAAAPVTNAVEEDSAAVGAAAEELARELESELKPGQLVVSPRVTYAGLTLKTAQGSQGLAVPFFYDSSASRWECGWSTQQIKAALGTSATVATPAAGAQPTPTTPATAPPSRPQLASGPGPKLPRGWSYEPNTGLVTAMDGTEMPALKAGERYGMIEAAAGDTPRPVIFSADGVARIIIGP
jgi:hypothetical protein